MPDQTYAARLRDMARRARFTLPAQGNGTVTTLWLDQLISPDKVDAIAEALEMLQLMVDGLGKMAEEDAGLPLRQWELFTIRNVAIGKLDTLDRRAGREEG